MFDIYTNSALQAHDCSRRFMDYYAKVRKSFVVSIGIVDFCCNRNNFVFFGYFLLNIINYILSLVYFLSGSIILIINILFGKRYIDSLEGVATVALPITPFRFTILLKALIK